MCLVKMYIKELIHFPKKQYKIVFKNIFFWYERIQLYDLYIIRKIFLILIQEKKTIFFYEKTNIAIHTDSKTLLMNELKIIKLFLANKLYILWHDNKRKLIQFIEKNKEKYQLDNEMIRICWYDEQRAYYLSQNKLVHL